MKRTVDKENGETTNWDDLIDTLEADSWERDKERIGERAAYPADEALQEAVRQGIVQGKRSGRRVKRRRAGYGAAAALLGIFLLMTAFTRVSPAFASMLSGIPILSQYVELIAADASLRLAAENAFMQPVGVSDEQSGKKLTVPFIMTDGRRLVLFYSLEGEGVTGDSRLDNTVISGVNGEELPAGYMWAAGPDDGETIAAKYDKLDMYLQEGTALPDRVKFKAQAEGETFEVTFDIDHSIYENRQEEYNVDKTFAIGGQVYRVDKLTVTPLQASVLIKAMPGNTKQTHLLNELALEDEKGRRWTSKAGFGSFDGTDGVEQTFYSSYFEKPQHLTLVAGGAYQTERGKKLVVDTDKKRTVDTPDKRISLTDARTSDAGTALKLTFEIKGLDKSEGTLSYSLFDINGTFKDGEGVAYSFRHYYESGQTQQPDGTIDQRAVFTIPNVPYKQPLTLDLYQYPGYVNEPISVPLH